LSGASYWAADIANELSQGDLVSDAWVGASANPRAGLISAPTGKGGLKFWQEAAWKADEQGFGHFLSRGRATHALILSQSCEIDKKGGKAPVLYAPVLGLQASVKDEAAREVIRAGNRYAFFYLPAIDGIIEESYVDLRAITYAPRAVIDVSFRRASASEEGAGALAAHLVAFFTRVDVAQIKV